MYILLSSSPLRRCWTFAGPKEGSSQHMHPGWSVISLAVAGGCPVNQTLVARLWVQHLHHYNTLYSFLHKSNHFYATGFTVFFEIPNVCFKFLTRKSLYLVNLSWLIDSSVCVISGLSVCYVGNAPWILNASVQDNILFGRPMERKRSAVAVSTQFLQRSFY